MRGLKSEGASSRLSDVLRNLRAAIVPLHPQGRKWLRFLHSLDLDPETLPKPVPPLGPRDFIICGAPRSGTTLLSAMLFQPPEVVTVVEPWSGMRFPPRELFTLIREQIDGIGELSSSKLDVEDLIHNGLVRWVQNEKSTSLEIMSEDYLLGVKWPAYWRYLGLLENTKFLVCTRHPAEVIASFKQKGGRIGLGLEYDTAFNRRFNDELRAATNDISLRRILFYERVYSYVARHLGENTMLVRYERWFTDPDQLLQEIAVFLGTESLSMPATIRSPEIKPALNDSELRSIRETCKSATLLGYSL